MNVEMLRNLVVLALSIALSGCNLQSADPLLFDDEGQLREVVYRFEIDEEGIEDCEEFDDELESSLETVQVPIVGGDGEPVLIGVGGLAVCVGELNGVEGLGGGLYVEGAEGLDPNEMLGIPDDSEDAENGVEVLTEEHNGQDTGRRPMLVYDPTPEPAGE